MPKINQEEYEILKRLINRIRKAKGFIARDEDGMLYAHRVKPRRYTNGCWVDGYLKVRVQQHLFQFIQWEDENPYNITKLIEEYESEETEVNKQKLIEKWESAIEDAEFYGKGKEDRLIEYMRDFVDDLNQLDELEVLSQEFINEKAVEVYADTADAEVHAVFRMRDLQNLLVPKQEKPIVPQHVADWFEEMSLLTTLSYVLGELNKAYGNNQKMYRWVKTLTGPSPNDLANAQEIIARMFLDGYTVEEEQKYFAKIKGHENIGSDDKYWNYCITDESLDIGDNKVHADVLAEYVLNATKDEWENLGINDDNADFIKVEELEE